LRAFGDEIHPTVLYIEKAWERAERSVCLFSFICLLVFLPLLPRKMNFCSLNNFEESTECCVCYMELSLSTDCIAVTGGGALPAAPLGVRGMHPADFLS